ncbi:Fbox domain containing protein [Acanthamoeba castellanii str. Neff]|uniref:Fbox domain containing protein n=1 Tax=Acanthamoeba castellanii (strain ATCC 30010 / Neff) TaxID=1257118 RepID=L8GUJ5_ACACF|nr:Fbox domain containing protein [Acanthamoeba castellanii str. Neff]ELR16303.1 Fbox domain containing protein [Acanthamoeba castellanii str. Neff]
MENEDETLLVGLDTNVVACVLAHLSPPDLTRVGQTCRALEREAASDVAWCSLFLRRFGSDFWGEAAGLHPYLPDAVAPDARNEWLQHRVSELYALFAARTPKPASSSSTEACEDDADGFVPPLLEFVKQHAAPSEGYGGWKLAYRRMHEMVTEWTRPADEGIIVAGLVPFATLSALADIMKLELGLGLGDEPTNGKEDSKPPLGPAFDMLSPGGECRVLRVEGYHNIYYSCNGQTTTTNISVIRKPRNWYCEGNPFFRGLRTTLSPDVKIVYVVDAQKMSDSEDHAERAYRELHGMLGEGKGRFEKGLAVVLFLINATDPDHVQNTLGRLKVPKFTVPLHWCPYYAGPVIFIAAPLKPKKVRRSLKWLLKQPTSRPHWDARGFLLCALQGKKGDSCRSWCAS